MKKTAKSLITLIISFIWLIIIIVGLILLLT